MGTTPPKDETPAGVIQRAGHTVNIITEAATDTAYGHRGRSAYALILLLIIGLVLAGSSATVPVLAIGLVAVILLAVWVGGR